MTAQPTTSGPSVGHPVVEHRVWIDQDLCTGDGICVQEARNVFEFDIDGLAYVKNADGDLLTAPAAQSDVPRRHVRRGRRGRPQVPRCLHPRGSGR